MKAKITDTDIFRLLFQYVARFIEIAHFDVKKKSFRVRSIDPHDFCYIDLIFYPEFFKKYEVDNEQSFTIECSKLSKILPTLTSSEIFLEINDGQIQFSIGKDWIFTFAIKWIRSNSYNLPEPNLIEYDVTINITGKELADIIRKASTVSHEITFSVPNPNNFIIFAAKENYSFVAKTVNPYFKIESRKPASVSVIIDYLKLLQPFMKKCESTKIFIGNDKPLRIDFIYENKGLFSFCFSQRKREKCRRLERKNRYGTSLPRISMRTFEQYITQLSKYPEGINSMLLDFTGLETKGKDYWRFCDILSLAYKDEGKIKLTPLGEAFVSLFNKDQKKAKKFLHILAKNIISPYRVMVNELENPIPLDKIKQEINAVLNRENHPIINGQDLSTLIDIAKWCGVVKVKGGLLSFSDIE